MRAEEVAVGHVDGTSLSTASSSSAQRTNSRRWSHEIRRCLRPGGHLLITAPTQDATSLTRQGLYRRLRAVCYRRVPGVVSFYDTNSLPRLVEAGGLIAIECVGEPGRVSVLARA